MSDEAIPKDLEIRVSDAAALQADFNAQVQTVKNLEDQLKATWKSVEEQMIAADVKSIKGDWGSLTIVDKTTYRAEDLDKVPEEFIKRALDTKKISAAVTLEGELPAGVIESNIKYLMKRIKK